MRQAFPRDKHQPDFVTPPLPRRNGQCTAIPTRIVGARMKALGSESRANVNQNAQDK